MEVAKRQRVVFKNLPMFSTLVDAELKLWMNQLKPLQLENPDATWTLYIYPPAGKEYRQPESKRAFRLSDFSEYHRYLTSGTATWSPIALHAGSREALQPRNHQLLWLAGVTFTIMPYKTEHKLMEEHFQRPIPSPKLRGAREFMGERVDFTCIEQLDRLYKVSLEMCKDRVREFDEAAMDVTLEKEIEMLRKFKYPQNFPFRIPKRTILDDLEEWDPWGLPCRMHKTVSPKTDSTLSIPTFSSIVDKELNQWRLQLKEFKPKSKLTVPSDEAFTLYVYPPAGKEYRGQDTARMLRLYDLATYNLYLSSNIATWKPFVMTAEREEVLRPQNSQLLWLVGITFCIVPFGTKVNLEETHFQRPLPSPKLRGPQEFMGQRVDFTCTEQLNELYNSSLTSCLDRMIGIDVQRTEHIKRKTAVREATSLNIFF